MKIPCAERLPFIVSGLTFLQPALTNAQFYNLTMVATALVLGGKFSLSAINRMWLGDKSVSALSHFFSHAKFSTTEMQNLYALQIMHLYKLKDGYYCIDDTMKHHTNYCKWIHGVFILFDHAIKTNLKATCVVVLYYNDGGVIKFPISHKIYYQDTENMSWQNGKRYVCKPKYELAIEMLQWATDHGFPRGIVLADSWFGSGPFVKGLKNLGMSYVIEIKHSLNVRVPCENPKLTPTGKIAKRQYDLIKLPDVFKAILTISKCGFAANIEIGKKEKVLYHTKVITARLNSIAGKHRIIQSIDPAKQTIKYLLTNELTWEATKTISAYSHRWVIEEFFRNAKQLTDMEGATIRSEQGVTLALCLVSWIDSLLHFENYKRSTAGNLSKEPLTVPSIVRQAQCENLEAFMDRVQKDEDLVQKWIAVEKKRLGRKRKKHKELIQIEECAEESAKIELDQAA
jgi:SRSO17 transposase